VRSLLTAVQPRSTDNFYLVDTVKFADIQRYTAKPQNPPCFLNASKREAKAAAPRRARWTAGTAQEQRRRHERDLQHPPDVLPTDVTAVAWPPQTLLVAMPWSRHASPSLCGTGTGHLAMWHRLPIPTTAFSQGKEPLECFTAELLA